jgi:ABC-2 type transport system permease protein
MICRTALAFMKRDIRIAISYRAAFALQLLGIFVSVPMLFFVGKFFDGADLKILERYNSNFFAFLLIGVALLDYLAISLRTFGQILREGQLMGTLELVLLSPTSLAEVLIFSSFFLYLFTSIRFVLYLVVGLCLGLPLAGANFAGAIIIIFLSILSFAPFGIISASIIMVIKRGLGFTSIVSGASLFLGGVLYPTDFLEHPALQFCSKIIPFTHSLEGMRMALLSQTPATMTDLLPTFGILILFAVILMPLSILSFHWAVRRTKRTGTLVQY